MDFEAATEMARCAGFGERHSGLWWDGTNPEIENVLKKVSDAHGMIRNVYLGGNVGVGKTAYLCCMLKNLFFTQSQIERIPGKIHPSIPRAFAMGVIFATHHEINDIMRDKFSDRPDSTYEPLDLMKIPLLLIDDLASAHETGFSVAEFEFIMNARWERNLTTWVTSNVTAGSLEKKADWKRIASRLLDGAVRIDIAGKDRRRANAE